MGQNAQDEYVTLPQHYVTLPLALHNRLVDAYDRHPTLRHSDRFDEFGKNDSLVQNRIRPTIL